jgi:TonB family protein
MSRCSSTCGRALAIGAVLTLLATPASAQAVFSGVVLGPDDLPVEGVTIYVTNITTGEQLDFTTLPNGRFEFSGLREGDYRLTAERYSFGNPVITLRAGEMVERELKVPFGPFTAEWLVLPAATLSTRINSERRPGFRCSDRMIINVSGVWQPFCNLSFLVDEFEADTQQAGSGAAFAGPRLIGAPDQAYPAALLEARAEGVVTLEIRIGSDGSQNGGRVLSSDNPALNDAALASVAAARWAPARMRGTPVEVPVTVTITFRMQTLQQPPGGVVQSIAQAQPPAVRVERPTAD